jgi:acetyl-CoA synthetase
MRRILRKVAAGETDSLGDISTLLNPEVVEEIVKGQIQSHPKGDQPLGEK